MKRNDENRESFVKRLLALGVTNLTVIGVGLASGFILLVRNGLELWTAYVR